jgi:hypothetical protein
MRRQALALTLLASLGHGLALASVKPSVSKAIGGRTMPGYRAVHGSAVRLRRPWRQPALAEAPDARPSLKVGGTPYLDGRHYADVRDVALKLLRRYDPRDHFFIAIGRSPTALAAFLAELNPHIVMTFPASDLRLGVQAEWRSEFFDHFEKLIPEDVLQGRRKIVLFDRSHDRSGTSLAAMKRLLEQYLARRQGKNVRVRAVGLAKGGPLVEGVRHLSTARYPHVFQYFQGADHDELFAPFRDKHRIGTEALEDVNPNPNHTRLRDALRERMAGDRTLRDALREDFADLLGE